MEHDAKCHFLNYGAGPGVCDCPARFVDFDRSGCSTDVQLDALQQWRGFHFVDGVHTTKLLFGRQVRQQQRFTRNTQRGVKLVVRRPIRGGALVNNGTYVARIQICNGGSFMAEATGGTPELALERLFEKVSVFGARLHVVPE